LCVRWYLRYLLSFRHIAEMMAERGLRLDRSCIWRWVPIYGPEVDKRCRRHLKPTNKSWRLEETIHQGQRPRSVPVPGSGFHRVDHRLLNSAGRFRRIDRKPIRPPQPRLPRTPADQSRRRARKRKHNPAPQYAFLSQPKENKSKASTPATSDIHNAPFWSGPAVVAAIFSIASPVTTGGAAGVGATVGDLPGA
jgi:hypothetical protein